MSSFEESGVEAGVSSWRLLSTVRPSLKGFSAARMNLVSNRATWDPLSLCNL